MVVDADLSGQGAVEVVDALGHALAVDAAGKVRGFAVGVRLTGALVVYADAEVAVEAYAAILFSLADSRRGNAHAVGAHQAFRSGAILASGAGGHTHVAATDLAGGATGVGHASGDAAALLAVLARGAVGPEKTFDAFMGPLVTEPVRAVCGVGAAGAALVVLAELAGGAVAVLAAPRGALVALADEAGVAVRVLEALRA